MGCRPACDGGGELPKRGRGSGVRQCQRLESTIACVSHRRESHPRRAAQAPSDAPAAARRRLGSELGNERRQAVWVGAGDRGAPRGTLREAAVAHREKSLRKRDARVVLAVTPLGPRLAGAALPVA